VHRRTLLTGAASVAGLAAAGLASPAIAQKIPTLRFVPQSNLAVLDPVWTTATVTSNHGYYVFDTLYAMDSSMLPRPQMAEGQEVSDNGRTWRIKLREQLRFHDGTPVRAIDCITSLQRWASRDPFGQLLTKVADSWNAPGDRTIEIRLTRPFPLLLTALAKADASVPFIMPERLARIDANTAITEMVGSGPYRFVASEFNSGNRVVYEKFAGYVPRSEPADNASGGKVAHFQRIEWSIIPDPATAAAALQNKEVDWWEQPLPDLLPVLSANEDITLQITDTGGKLSLMRLNHLQPPFNDVRLRRAVLMAVNQKDYMIAANGEDTSLWTTCPCLYPRNTPYFSDDAGRLMKASPAAARAALKEAGYAGQKVVIINPTDYPNIGPLGQVTAQLLHDIGMTVDLQESDWGTVVQRRANRGPIESGGWSIFHTTGSIGSYANPAVSPLVRGQGDAGWFGWWNSPKAEEMVQDWLVAPDEASQKKIAEAIGTLALEEVATVPLGQFFIKAAFRKTITGILHGSSPYPWNVRPV
jgi:peptide/nickel transport system substrate-binding protein